MNKTGAKMLTASEREWLENRKPGDWCVTHDCSAMFEGECISVTCYMDISWLYRDAAEFESRVAAKLAELFAKISLVDSTTGFDCESSCPAFSMCCTIQRQGMPCGDAILMYAQLTVEEEMDAEN